ncbi:MAG: excinuclease ABC subunit B [Candidatus Komeilibacteria bacterium RIFCSPHIGHO2_01_FULL_52_14]|uniref:UvrABC system protein B n=1 Tax=Candidatus Komeilibacteria bacterium RIFCSPHIGHO2_01_FULL_52_14 TaxID=1798549 RepID=A0A1G2BJB3_9BACT|nr:MAG: excinuclease ABC subunit B [Candidatus Komeilibacteria bacterium RIFCSPHIGHO2_01_FULL_52_14]
MTSSGFKLTSQFKPTGDQPVAITALVKGLGKGFQKQTLRGVTGSGKTFTIANVIASAQRPTLVISHNKTLAAQLASEFQSFFPKNAVHYFVSYYDYYQPEAYIPTTDTHIDKETQINEEIDRLRHAATQAVLTRRDVIIVASVSCIYGLGSPEEYLKVRLELEVGKEYSREQILRQLVRLQYERNDLSLVRGAYTVKGEIIEVVNSSDVDSFYRFEFNGRKLAKIKRVGYLTRDVEDAKLRSAAIFPAKHYLAPEQDQKGILADIRNDLEERIVFFKKHEKLIEAQRIEERVRFDLEMIETVGYCNGIENYSRYFDRRKPGEPPATLLDYFPDDYLLVVDESHITLPQIRGMYHGDRSRKEVLVQYGWRLPAAIDNRPLNWDEFLERTGQALYMSATPADYELKASRQVVEQLIRPTGLLDPSVEVRKTAGQLADVEREILARVSKGQRVLITTLTKRLAEDLTEHLLLRNIKVQYLHSDIDTLDRLTILKDLRQGKYDVLVGINLLREGLDLPEVSLVVILDADKEGFLRNDTSLIQTMGRAARHADGYVIMYADRMTDSMKAAIDETERRRKIQQAYNKRNRVVPTTIVRVIKDTELKGLDVRKEFAQEVKHLDRAEKTYLIETLQAQMKLAADNLNFEHAALLRDQITILRKTRGRK